MNIERSNIIDNLRLYKQNYQDKSDSHRCFDDHRSRNVLKAMGLNPNANIKQIYDLKLNSDLAPKKPIPHLLHQVWVGMADDDGNVPLMGKNYEKNLLNNFMHFDESWKIYFWTNNAYSIPEQIKNHPQVELKFYDQEFNELQSYFNILSKNKGLLSLLSNVVRAKSLMEYGGVYFDIDYKLCRKIDGLIEKYDFILGQDSKINIYAGNAFIAGHQNHPVISEYFTTMINNFSKETASIIAANSCHFINWRFLGFGPPSLTFAFLKKAFEDDNKDVVLGWGILLDYRREPG